MSNDLNLKVMQKHINSNRVMEVKNNFKNGASLRSWTSRKNITSLIIGIIISTITGLTSCNDVSECKTKKSEYDCKDWCFGGFLTEGYDYNASTKECCCWYSFNFKER